MGNNSLVLTKRMAQAIIKEGVIHNMELFNDLTNELKQATDDPEAKALLNRLNLIKISSINKMASAPPVQEKASAPAEQEEAVDEVVNEPPPPPPVKSIPPAQKPAINMTQKPSPPPVTQKAAVKPAPVVKPIVKEEVKTEEQEKPIKKKMGMGVWIAIGIVVVLVAAGVIWFFMNYRIVA